MHKHTPGPWEAESNGVHKGAQCVAITHARDGEARIADAHLISAAPDLLEALQSFVKVHEFHSHADRPWYLDAKRALAKALGNPSA